MRSIRDNNGRVQLQKTIGIWLSKAAEVLAVPIILIGTASGCGSSAGTDGTETVDSVKGELVSGAQNVSDGIVPNSLVESETAAVGIGAVLATAYNAPHANGEICHGYGGLGMTVWNGSWHGIRFTPANGSSLFIGDPSIAAYDPGGSSVTVYVGTLSQSETWWNAQQKQGDGCISLANFNPAPDQLCVVTASVPKSGSGAITVTNTRCMTPGGSVDGTALTAVNNTPYIASWHNSNSVVFYRASDGALLASPLTSHTIKGHPIFSKYDNLHLYAPDSAGRFWSASYSTSGGTWVGESGVPNTYPFQWGSTLPFGLRGGREYSASVLPNDTGPGRFVLAYRDTRGRIVVYTQSVSGWGLAFTSPAGYSAWHPALEMATFPAPAGQDPPYRSYSLGLTYWDNMPGSGGSASLKYTIGLSPTPIVLASETPCPHSGYWGDYDEMSVWNNYTANPIFYRFITDSTKSACLADTTYWSTNTPQHVSVLSFR